jgi:hypothetical protein
VTRWGALVAIGLALAPRVARAQSSNGDGARADAAFKEGKRLLEKGDLAEACAHFAESKRQAPAIGVTLYLGDCYQRLGKTASAWNEFRAAETMARAQSDKRADLAHTRAHALEPKLETIALHLGASQTKDGLEVALDGRPVHDPWTAPVPVDPGDHVLVVRLGALTRQYDVHVDAEAPAAAVKVEGIVEPVAAHPAIASTPPEPAPAPVADAAPASAPEESPEPPAPLQDTGSDPKRVWLSLTLAGAGVVGLAVGSAFGVMALSDRNTSNAGPCNAADVCTSRGLQLRDDAIREGWVSTIGIAAGAVALAAGATVYFAWPHPSTGKTAVVVSAGPVAGGAAAVVGATF